MKLPTFEDIHTIGKIVAENAQYKHYHYPEMLMRYDSNFLEFKVMPSLPYFKEAEDYLMNCHQKNGQNHLKFYFPANLKPTDELLAYLAETGYEIGFLELYAILPEYFPPVTNNLDIDIVEVTEENLEIFLYLQYQFDIILGIEFAKQNADLAIRQFKDPTIKQMIAFYKGVPAGYVNVILLVETVEIDSLTVVEKFQRKGIGSSIQKYIMESFPDKMIILLADGEDTPREMYQKQNYQYGGFKYEVQKVF